MIFICRVTSTSISSSSWEHGLRAMATLTLELVFSRELVTSLLLWLRTPHTGWTNASSMEENLWRVDFYSTPTLNTQTRCPSRITSHLSNIGSPLKCGHQTSYSRSTTLSSQMAWCIYLRRSKGSRTQATLVSPHFTALIFWPSSAPVL